LADAIDTDKTNEFRICAVYPPQNGA